MKTIPLTQGKVALIDDRDYPTVLQHRWCAAKLGNIYYAHALIDGHTASMHRLIMGNPPGISVDHINGDGLDNRRSNLRLANQSQQGRNTPKHKNNKSGFKGVSWCKGFWMATIYVNQRKLYLGGFRNPVDAARAYNEAAKKYFGEFARLNNC